MPIRRAVRMTRQAISPRLAIRIFLNIKFSLYRIAGEGGECRKRETGEGRCAPPPPCSLRERSLSRNAGEGKSEGDVVVLLPWVLEFLVAQHAERAAEAAAGGGGGDHVVDKAATGGDEGVGEFLAVFLCS